jgi:hypothetical protein
MTRDSIALYLAAVAALLAYLITDGRSPAEWAYMDWLKFLAAAAGYGIGKLQSSPLPGK